MAAPTVQPVQQQPGRLVDEGQGPPGVEVEVNLPVHCLARTTLRALLLAASANTP